MGARTSRPHASGNACVPGLELNVVLPELLEHPINNVVVQSVVIAEPFKWKNTGMGLLYRGSNLVPNQRLHKQKTIVGRWSRGGCR